MASAQEFSSPGAHMASISGSRVVDVGSSTGRGPGESSNVLYSPRAYDNINRGYQLHTDEVYGSSSRERADRYNDYYMRYNSQLFNSAKEYDMYMSNTAIQRQVADLKAAGLNPILAANLGGAVYKGVNAPYLSISPASALGNFLDYESSIYGTDVSASTAIETTKLENDSREFIAQYQKTMDLMLQQDAQSFKQSFLLLETEAQKILDNNIFENNKNLKLIGLENDKQLAEFKEQLSRTSYVLEKTADVEVAKSLYWINKTGYDLKNADGFTQGLVRCMDMLNNLHFTIPVG